MRASEGFTGQVRRWSLLGWLYSHCSSSPTEGAVQKQPKSRSLTTRSSSVSAAAAPPASLIETPEMETWSDSSSSSSSSVWDSSRDPSGQAVVAVALVSRVALVEAAFRSEQIIGAVWRHSVSPSKNPFELLDISVSSIFSCLVAFRAHFVVWKQLSTDCTFFKLHSLCVPSHCSSMYIDLF